MNTREFTQFWRNPNIPGLDLMYATYITQNFAPHWHEEYCIGVVEDGVQQYFYRRGTHIGTRNTVLVCMPGEIHTGHSPASSWTYRMFYVSAGILTSISEQLAGKSTPLPDFSGTTIDDPYVAALLRRAHHTLSDDTATTLAQQSTLLIALTQLVYRHGDYSIKPETIADHRPAIQRARDYLDAHYAENVSLDELAAVAYLSPFQLIRSFQQQIGLTPHAYLIHTRVMQARLLLKSGWTAAQAATETGFADQSHLHRHFKRMLGVTPGQYK
ncbi:MAG: AraC family transcriptional regulator [Chloroflexi bacterium]|nr:AraC family transcriptional regulator [Chloroflexota bacterium]